MILDHEGVAWFPTEEHDAWGDRVYTDGLYRLSREQIATLDEQLMKALAFL